MSSSHEWWSSTESTERPMSFTFRRWNSGLSFATEPSSVVHIGVKSLGCEKSTAHESPIHSWNRIVPSVVCATKSGAVSPSCRPIVLPPCSSAPILYWYKPLQGCRFARKGQLAASRGWPDRAMLGAAPAVRARGRDQGSKGPPRTARPPGSDEARARTPGRGRGARGEIELPKDVGQVPVHRVLAQDEPLSDFRVAQSLCDELEHVEFARRQYRSGSG